MKRGKKATLAQIKRALKSSGGLIGPAAAKLKIARQSLHARIASNPELQTFIADLDAALLDKAESNIARDVKKGDNSTSRWVLERKGKDRGYGNKVALGLDDDAIDQLVAGFGGDVAALTALRNSLDPSSA